MRLMGPKNGFLRDETGGVAFTYAVVCGLISIASWVTMQADDGRTIAFWTFVKSLL
jgi:Flp pilus assembly pilin Flp